jgi:UPF0755 protein
VTVAAALIVVIGLGGLWVESQMNPSDRGRLVSVVVPKGSSSARIAELLAKAGVVHDAFLFTLYLEVHGGTLYPGTYSLHRSSSYSAALAALRHGPRSLSLTIPEGYTLRQIAASVAALPGLHLSAAAFVRDATDGVVRSPYEPAGTNDLEGFLFPATYQVQPGEGELDIIKQMVSAFDARASALGLSQAAAALGMTPYQVVTVASIVEKEAKLDADRGPVASALYNRLRAGMPLGADSTQTYWLRAESANPDLVPTPSQLDQPSPYNTRLNKGLPPTPIANPGMPSLEAAAHPPATSYLYFVEIKPDGELGFASNDAGFLKLEAECRAAGLC